MSIKFYTNYDKPKNDGESYVGVESVTVPDQAEPVAVTVARCLRGEVLQHVRDVYYDLDGKLSADEAFAQADPTMAPGFDLADVPNSLESVAVATDGTSDGSSVAEPKDTESLEKKDSETESKES